MRWDTGTPKGYGFTYDGLSRLTAADYADGSSFTSNQNRYNTSYGYDNNGNLSSLSRYLNATQIDNLTYTYISSGNRLQSVNDATGNANGYDDNNGTYNYDNNGNLGYDPSKGTYLSYNYLNLPEQVQFGANDNLRYTYDAAGNKLVKVVDGTVSGNNTRLDYSGNFVYENDELKAIFTSAGRIIPFDNNGSIVYKFEYNLQDHLGNTRVVFSGHSNGQPEVMQVTDYYPFGLVMNQTNTFADGVLPNKYLYNGKELQDDELAGNSLGWYDYGARFYDAELGRWHVIDNKAEKYNSTSPFTYALNNPILFLDPDGNEVIVSIAGKNRQAGFKKYMQTASGRAFVAQFLKKGETVQGYDFTAPSTGKYANSTLRFFAQRNLASNVIGRAYTLHKGEDGKLGEELLTTRRPVSKSDIDKLQQNKSFEIGVALNANMDRTSDQWAETIGHEVFVHSVNNASRVQSVIEALLNGDGFDDILKHIGTLQSQAANADAEHKRLNEGKDIDYNQYMKELEEKKKEDEEQN